MERLVGIEGVRVLNESFFNEFTLDLPVPADGVVNALARRGILGGVPLSRFEPDNGELANLMVVAATEMTTGEEIESLASALEEILP